MIFFFIKENIYDFFFIKENIYDFFIKNKKHMIREKSYAKKLRKKLYMNIL